MVEHSKVKSPKDIIRINELIRKEISQASTRARIVKLVRQSQYLVTLSFTSAWRKAFKNIKVLRRTSKREYTKTAKYANRKIKGDKLDTKYGD